MVLTEQCYEFETELTCELLNVLVIQQLMRTFCGSGMSSIAFRLAPLTGGLSCWSKRICCNWTPRCSVYGTYLAYDINESLWQVDHK